MKVPSRHAKTSTAIVTGLTGALLVGGTPVHGATKAPGGQAVIAWSAEITYTPGQTTPRISTTEVGIRNVDQDGHATGDRVPVPATRTATEVIRDAVACRTTGRPAEGVQVFAPYRYSITTAYGSFTLAALFANSGGTGKNLGMQGSDQWGGCLAAGGVAATGYRLLQAGAGMTTAETDQPEKLGQDWPSGPAPAAYTRGTVFPSGAESGLAATIHQSPGGQLGGSIIAPSEVGGFENHARNAVFAWWRDPCTNDGRCTAPSGSTGFQGATATALWALDTGRPGHYLISGFLRIVCPGRCA